MSSKGIFGSGSSDSDKPASPFGTPSDDSDSSPASPFAAANPKSSPFAVVGDSDSPSNDLTGSGTGKPAKLPEKRDAPSQESPFSLAEPSEGYGMEPSSPFGGGGGGSPFETAPSPFAAAPADVPAPAPAADAGAVPAMKSEPAREEPEKPAAKEETSSKPEWPSAPEPKPEPEPEPKPAPVATTSPAPAAPAAAPAPAAAATAAAVSTGTLGETTPIRQLELRAIFGVDRELSSDEILQRLQGLAGVRRVSRIGPEELAAMDTLRLALAGMASESTPLKISLGSAPVDFIREGNAVLAVMTDGSFAPGVRETIIIAARELDRMA